MRRKVSDKQIKNAIKHHLTMRQAALSVGLHLTSFIRHAKRLKIYNPNQGRRGIKRGIYKHSRIPLSEILNGKHPGYAHSSLRERLFKENIKQKICEKCKLEDLELPYNIDHIDGDCTNHKLNNLQVLCPNCHSKTSTFAGRNRKVIKKCTNDKTMIDLILKGYDNRILLNKLKMVPNGSNYRRVDRLRIIIDYIKNKPK